MPEALVEVIDSYATTRVTNTLENPVKITLFEPFKIEILNESEIFFFEKM